MLAGAAAVVLPAPLRRHEARDLTNGLTNTRALTTPYVSA